MHPELITIPGVTTIKMYGFFMMVGFLTGVWMAMRRAAKVNVDPDKVLDASFYALIFGVIGARAFYVIHYWPTQFADRPNKLLAIIDIRQGGLEFLGGFLAAFAAIFIYLRMKRQSLRLFMDILAPSVAWGIAVGRIGCFFNGCCYGGVCLVPDTHEARFPWAVEFPFTSSPQLAQWQDRKVTIPAELLITEKSMLLPNVVPMEQIEVSPERRAGPRREYEQAKEAYRLARQDAPNAPATEELKAVLEAAREQLVEHEKQYIALKWAQQYPSRDKPERSLLISELQDIAIKAHSLPVHPVQLYASIHGFLLSGLLAAVFYQRKRHGVVIGLFFVCYPVARVLEEIIRADNPHDTFGLSVSQGISLAMFVVGMIYLIVLYTVIPQRSPLAQNAAAPSPKEGATDIHLD